MSNANILGAIVMVVFLVVWMVRVIFFESPDELPISEEVERACSGSCPECCSRCPENVKRVGPNGFWTDFSCPRCGYKITAHVSGSSGE